MATRNPRPPNHTDRATSPIHFTVPAYTAHGTEVLTRAASRIVSSPGGGAFTPKPKYPCTWWPSIELIRQSTV